MKENTTSTESNILAAAEKLFLERGFKSTSTTDIAMEAGCNQALVHYYFRTKENLFNKIFYAKFETVMRFIDSSMRDDSDIFQNIRNITEAYFKFLSANPNMPYFIFNELIRDPDRRETVRNNLISCQSNLQVLTRFKSMVDNAVKDGQIRDIDPFDLIFDAISLVVFSFISAPIFIDLLGRDSSCMEEFISHRKEEICILLTRGLLPDTNTARQHDATGL